MLNHKGRYKKTLKRNVYLSIDTHFEGYYGKYSETCNIIHKFKKERGSSGSYKYIVGVLHTNSFSSLLRYY
ncbi:hypothetical protein MetfoDRAFT_0300 [Methanotorris formicicus Mc-S-70]|uniref:Uncharacterized protein n=1 Tax=Methanotorris formicicus Mc-S-70 TaxID=647171 RepID=H1KWX7_9EURY|nr:hypothetical protein MetfoDRAFT_1550 [Methanotorris formicicus Mc-S-70]EHP88803.1 hypothetical protein MetfoDRAFT_0300 [Methanotorris formicicus Mc-S-70]